jgi:hypothetical protein
MKPLLTCPASQFCEFESAAAVAAYRIANPTHVFLPLRMRMLRSRSGTVGGLVFICSDIDAAAQLLHSLSVIEAEQVRNYARNKARGYQAKYAETRLTTPDAAVRLDRLIAGRSLVGNYRRIQQEKGLAIELGESLPDPIGSNWQHMVAKPEKAGSEYV